jgi:hypothetical protein
VASWPDLSPVVSDACRAGVIRIAASPVVLTPAPAGVAASIREAGRLQQYRNERVDLR